ncbi:AAA family ATPase [Methylopila sp. M107]|uniref:AAA family ATPase n=1 Tax=Methylopila sp. M107 TaxID=1101190 RepID=UPI0003768F5B|nr:AAA family ATPase [Methylopila sp. M107]
MKNADTNSYATDGQVTDPWAPPQVTPPRVAPETVKRWLAAIGRASAIAKEKGWSRAELSRRTDIPPGTLGPLLDGSYTGSYGNQVVKLENWLASLEEVRDRVFGLPEEPGYFETPTSRELTDTLLYAQQMPQIVVVTLGAGVGKTTTAKAYRSRPGVYMATMRPTTSGTHRMLQEIAHAIDVSERSANKLDRAIGQKIKRNGRQTLLIIDEAQNLKDEAVDQLRFFYDEYRCGIALLGNEEVYSRFGRAEPRDGYGQIHRRIGKRMRRMKPQAGDIAATLDAWGVADPEARKLLSAIGHKPGALGQITETVKLGIILAVGAGETLSAKHVREAWENRGGETLGVRP